ncbi:hypothetical protein PMAYCL1PPCAC_20728, partial [Pristionchus mayeri]
ESELDAERQKNEEQKPEIIENSKKMNEIQNEMAGLKNQLEESQQRVAGLRNELEESKQSVVDLKNKLEKSEKSVTDLDSQLENERARSNQRAIELAELNEECLLYDQKIDELKSKIAEYEKNQTTSNNTSPEEMVNDSVMDDDIFSTGADEADMGRRTTKPVITLFDVLNNVNVSAKKKKRGRKSRKEKMN